MHEGEYLRLQIRGKGLNVQQAADAVEVSRKTMYNYFKDKSLGEEVKTKFSREIGIDFTHIVTEPVVDYISERRKKKLEAKDELQYFDVNAKATPGRDLSTGLSISKATGVIKISDLLKGSEYAIRIAGTSMMPSYPPGAIIGIKEVDKWLINSGTVYVVEVEGDVWIKRLFYTTDKTVYRLVSDNSAKFESGPMQGEYLNPPFDIKADEIRRLFVVTGVFKSNILTVIE